MRMHAVQTVKRINFGAYVIQNILLKGSEFPKHVCAMSAYVMSMFMCVCVVCVCMYIHVSTYQYYLGFANSVF